MINDPENARGLTSVIVPCFNQLAYTRLCIASLVRHTSPPWELIVIDDGSTDGTGTYLAGVQDAAGFSVTVVSVAESRGFPAACNLGLAQARGDYIVLLNNDAIVTDAWLDQLIALADSDPTIGAVGPMSNFAAPPQLVPDVPYGDDLDAMRHFAATWRADRRGLWFSAAKLSGFCLLTKRRAYEAVGPLDERFGLGFFDDDDWCIRLREAGYMPAVAHDLFVHHFGSRTFLGSGVDVDRLLVENLEKFRAKWGPDTPSVQPVQLPIRTPRPDCDPGVGPETPGPDLLREASGEETRRVRVSLTMIVRDEEANLPACLDSVRGLFDEIIVVDTGSTDRTVEVARSFGAQVFDFVWIDDFAAARNAALARATGDYAFWLDADDRVEPAQGAKLKRLFDGLRPDSGAFVVRCSCDAGSDGGGATVVDHVRLFPVREDVRWTYRVHEQILPALRQAGIEVRWTDAVVRHVGYNDPVVRRRKLERDRAILEAERAGRPDDPFVLFNLGQIAMEVGETEVALAHLQRSLSRSTPADSITKKLYALIARAHQDLGEVSEALAACNAGLANDPDDAELLFRKGMLHRLQGEPSAARSCWRRILTLRRPEKFASVDEGIYGHVTRRNLAVLAEERGDFAEARSYWADVLAEHPGDPESTEAIGRLARRVGERVPG